MTNDTIHSELMGLKTLMETQFTAINERLDKINGRVGKNEDKVNDILIERARYVEEQKGIVNLHYLNCPNNKKIEEINTKYEDVTFFVKHPNLFVGGMVVVVIFTLLTFFESNKAVQNLFSPTKTEHTK